MQFCILIWIWIDSESANPTVIFSTTQECVYCEQWQICDATQWSALGGLSWAAQIDRVLVRKTISTSHFKDCLSFTDLHLFFVLVQFLVLVQFHSLLTEKIYPLNLFPVWPQDKCFQFKIKIPEGLNKLHSRYCVWQHQWSTVWTVACSALQSDNRRVTAAF